MLIWVNTETKKKGVKLKNFLAKMSSSQSILASKSTTTKVSVAKKNTKIWCLETF
jgi:hypothetical protein